MQEQNEMFEFDYTGLIARISDVLGKESYLSFAKRAGMSDTAFKRYIINGTVPPVDKAWMIACAASKPGASQEDIDALAAWIAFGVGNKKSQLQPHVSEQSASYSQHANDEVIWIDSLDVFASAGNGYINDDHSLSNKLPFSQLWLAENGLSGKHLSLIRVSGDSMEPTLFDKETPLVELLPDDYINRLIDDVYVLRINGQLLIKRIQRYMNGGFLIKSDNPRYDSYHLKEDNWPTDFKVIARWTGKKF